MRIGTQPSIVLQSPFVVLLVLAADSSSQTADNTALVVILDFPDAFFALSDFLEGRSVAIKMAISAVFLWPFSLSLDIILTIRHRTWRHLAGCPDRHFGNSFTSVEANLSFNSDGVLRTGNLL